MDWRSWLPPWLPTWCTSRAPPTQNLASGTGPIDPIQNLPPELQQWIFGFLDCQELITLSRTSHYYRPLGKLLDRSTKEKDAFVREHQRGLMHNFAWLETYIPNLPVLRWLENDLACYVCHRVRPYHAFPMRWVTTFWDKSNPLDGTPGFRRRCIDCSIAEGTYRPRTRISVTVDLYSLPGHMLRPSSDVTKAKFFCNVCKSLKDRTYQNPSCICPDCSARSRKDVQHGIFLEDGERVLVCKQCKQTTKLGAKKADVCGYCSAPRCQYCLKAIPGSTWCGKACSKTGYTLSRLRLAREAFLRDSHMNISTEELATQCDDVLARYSERDRADLLAIASIK